MNERIELAVVSFAALANLVVLAVITVSVLS